MWFLPAGHIAAWQRWRKPRVIERAEIEQQVQGGKEIKEVLAQLIPGMDVSSQDVPTTA